MKPTEACPGTNQAAIYRDEAVKFCYVLSHPGTEALHNVVVVDDNSSVGKTGDDLNVAFSRLIDLDKDGIANDLPAGGVVFGNAIGTAYFSQTGFLYPWPEGWARILPALR